MLTVSDLELHCCWSNVWSGDLTFGLLIYIPIPLSNLLSVGLTGDLLI